MPDRSGYESPYSLTLTASAGTDETSEAPTLISSYMDTSVLPDPDQRFCSIRFDVICEKLR